MNRLYFPLTRTAVAFVLILACLSSALQAQEERRQQPQWWFGAAAGANFNFYSGGLSVLNAAVTSPAEFSDGSGVGGFFSPLLEYRPGGIWGGMLHFGFDSRSGSFDDVTSGATTLGLTTSMNYLTLEPSVRIAPLSTSGLYFFAGPRVGFNVSKSFTLDATGAPSVSGDWRGTRGTVISGQVGAGYDISLSNPDATWQTQLAPFVAAHFGQGPRSEESWNLFSVRVGVGLKFGSTTQLKESVQRELAFSLRAPRIIPSERKVNETFPMRNYVFFNEGSTEIADRYVRLSPEEAAAFTEATLIEPQPKDLTGRSRRQLTVYHNLLNVLGDRLRKQPDATVTLTGASLAGERDARGLAESVKNYLVEVFGIEGSRISTAGRERPEIPSSRAGGTRELDLVRAEDRRVDISSSSADLLQPVRMISLQEDPLDTDVLFTAQGAGDLLASWSLEVTDEAGTTQRYGPFTADQERLSGKTILADKMEGQYTVTLIGETKGGQTIRKEETMRLARTDQPDDDLGLRFSIVFEFDQSKTVATYERFLTAVVVPLIPEGANVIIHGHTDIIGEESYNLKLSQARASETMTVIQRALAKEGKKRVRFDTYGFGEDIRRAPFGNQLPEERFYNRCVIIDIVPE